MDNVLIVEDEPRFLYFLEEALEEFSGQFAVLTAGNGEDALAVLAAKPVSVLVTDLNMPKLDGFGLLAHVNERYPGLPVIVMTGYARPDIRGRLPRDLVSFLEKPFTPDKLAQAIQSALVRDAPEGTVRGISLASFVQLIGMEQKTCLLEVTAPGRPKGILYFEKGVPFDAVFGSLTGQEAAFAVIGLENAGIRFLKPPARKVKRRISVSLANLVLEATRVKDEGAPEPPDDDDDDSGGFSPAFSAEDEPDLFGDPDAPDDGETFDGLVAALAAVPGCRAAALLNRAGSVLGRSSADPDLNMDRIALAAGETLLAAREVARALGAGGCSELSLRMPEGLPEVMVYVAGGSADFSVVAVLSPEADPDRVRRELETLLADLFGRHDL